MEFPLERCLVFPSRRNHICLIVWCFGPSGLLPYVLQLAVVFSMSRPLDDFPTGSEASNEVSLSDPNHIMMVPLIETQRPYCELVPALFWSCTSVLRYWHGNIHSSDALESSSPSQILKITVLEQRVAEQKHNTRDQKGLHHDAKVVLC